MIKLLVIADDFTGAMDTGVQFNTKGALIRAVSKGQIDPFQEADPDLQVLIIDAETRHMEPGTGLSNSISNRSGRCRGWCLLHL